MFKAFFGSALATVLTASFIGAATFSPSVSAASEAAVSENYGKLPLIFEPNRGQTDAQVKFLSRGKGYSLFLTENEAVLSLRGADDKDQALRMKLLGAHASPKITGIDRLPGVSNYFIGRDRTKWRAGVPHYARVGFEGVYAGIDLVYYGTAQRRLEFDFVVAPGADPSAINLGFEGAERLEIAESGDLIATLSEGEVRFLKPVIYQQESGTRKPVEGGYAFKDGRVTFDIAAYDRTKPLVVDPVLAYSTYLGGNDFDDGRGIAVDTAGSAYITGMTDSSNFPVTDLTEYSGTRDVFVAKLSPDGSELEYATFLGGGSSENVMDITVDGDGNAYVTGETASGDFPVLSAFRNSGGRAFVTKLGTLGELVYSTFLGPQRGFGIAVKPSCPNDDEPVCQIFVTGIASEFSAVPLTFGAFQTSPAGAFLAVLDPSAGPVGLVYGTFLGGTGNDEAVAVAVGGNGDAYITGRTTSDDFPTTPNAMDTNCAHDAVDDDCSAGTFDTFVTVLKPGTEGADDLVYSTYLGGGIGSFGRDISVKPGCRYECLVFVTGSTKSVDFPTTASALLDGHSGEADTFVTVINTAADSDPSNDLVYSTLFGGAEGMAIAADDLGRAYVAGHASGSSPDVPIRDAIQPDRRRIFATIIDTTKSNDESLLFSTYLGDGRTWRIAADGLGAAYLIGVTSSQEFPIIPGAFQEELAFSEAITRGPFGRKPQDPKPTQDAFVTKIAGPFPATGDITPIDVPSRPVAVDDFGYIAGEKSPLTILSSNGVLKNDTDPDPGPNPLLTAVLVRSPLNGTVELAGDGGFVYTPNAGFIGRDHFAYAASDGQANSNVAVAVIDVEDVNFPPVAVNDNYSVLENVPLMVATPGVLANDFDEDGDPLTASIISEPDFGTVNLDTGGGFIYTPNPDFTGPDEFTYNANDGFLPSNTATVSLIVTGGTMHIGDLDSAATDLGTTWNVTVTITVDDEDHEPVPNATLGWIFDMGKSGTVSSACSTNQLGQCSVSATVQGRGKARSDSVIFTVTSAGHEVATYDSSANHDPDGDSDGTSITAIKP